MSLLTAYKWMKENLYENKKFLKKKKLKIHFIEIIYSLLILNLLKYMSVNNAFFIYTFILK